MNHKMAGAAAIILLGGMIAYWVGMRENPSSATATDGSFHVAPDFRPLAIEKSSERPRLPALELPLQSTIATLIERADQGDAEAACRLALEYQKCDEVERQLMSVDDLSRGGDVENVVATVWMGSDSSSFYSGVERCAGVQPPAPGRVAELLRRSASNGNPAAMRAYATGAGFSYDSLLEEVDELRTYKVLGPQVARSAIQGGDGTVLLSLAAAYQPETHLFAKPLLAQAVSIDVVEALVLFEVARSELTTQARTEGSMWDHVNRQMANLEARASSEQKVESTRRANAIRASVRGPMRMPSDNKAALVSRASAGPLRPVECVS